MPLRNIPIQRKLMAVILLTSGVVLLLTWAAFLTYEAVALREGMVQALTTRAEIIAANCAAALAFQIEADATDVLSALKSDPGTVAACIYDVSGQVFATYPADSPPENFPAVPEKPGYRFEPSHLVIFCSVVHGNRPLGMVYIKTDLSALTERYRAYAWLALAVIVGSV